MRHPTDDVTTTEHAGETEYGKVNETIWIFRTSTLLALSERSGNIAVICVTVCYRMLSCHLHHAADITVCCSTVVYVCRFEITVAVSRLRLRSETNKHASMLDRFRVI